MGEHIFSWLNKLTQLMLLIAFFIIFLTFSLLSGLMVCSWSTRDLKSQGRFSIDSSGYTNMKISAGLGGSKLDARGGIIGGCIELQQLDSEGMIHMQAHHCCSTESNWKLVCWWLCTGSLAVASGIIASGFNGIVIAVQWWFLSLLSQTCSSVVC